MVRPRSLLFIALFALTGCDEGPATRSSPSPSPPSPSPDETHRIVVRIPPEMPASGSLITIPYTPEEIEEGRPEDPAAFVTTALPRIRVRHDAVAVDGVIAHVMALEAGRSRVVTIFDTADLGLDAVFGTPPGLARGVAELHPSNDGVAPTPLEGEPARPPREACEGERLTLLRIDAPETRRPGDDGERLACVELPPSYESAPRRRYPVLLAFPGFSGWHAGGDAWVAREIFARAAEAHGMELIIVGIGTRTAEGTSYLQRSERFGDWDGYVSERLIAELDTRFRTNGRRAAAGHSTGGWNALAFALHHPDLVDAVGASSPDPPDLDAWLLDDAGRVRPEWMGWMRAEAALGGRGQFVSWAAAWSPDDSERGFAWPVELASGALRPEVYARWQEASLASFVRTPAGRRAARKLSGAIAITAGQSDEFALFEPSERFVATLGQAEVDVRWTPTELGHFGHEERFEPLAQLIAERLGASAD